jgi:hypothetical protein
LSELIGSTVTLSLRITGCYYKGGMNSSGVTVIQIFMKKIIQNVLWRMNEHIIPYKKGKAIPVTGRDGP